MNYSKPRPVLGQVWAFSAFGEIQEIILLTRINSAAHFHGILLYSRDDEYENDVGMETHAEHVDTLHFNSDWQRIS